MKVDRELIEAVAKVSRLKLSDSEIDEFLPQLKEILKTFSEIAEVDTDDVNPSYHPVDIEPHLREDIAGQRDDREDILKLGLHKEGYFKGPKII